MLRSEASDTSDAELEDSISDFALQLNGRKDASVDIQFQNNRAYGAKSDRHRGYENVLDFI
jgi:hypothetical protein